MELTPVGKGGSDRDYFRVAAAGRATVVLMRYGRMYEENDGYASVADFLKRIGVSVPAIHGHDPLRRLIVMEDLGDTDLYALRGAPGRSAGGSTKGPSSWPRGCTPIPRTSFPPGSA
jgi:aminoglycoside/choline kinase family phosphotransferase